jgi:hypothetical protein
LVKAGVDGVKMGFMSVDTTPGMRRVIEYVRIFGRHKLVVNIHDNVCGFGIQRTFPQLLSVEGVAGDEHRDKDFTQRALIIPFNRAKAGRMDYTFVIRDGMLKQLRLSPLAQVAKSVILGVNGLWTLYWYSTWEEIAGVALDTQNPYSLWNEMSNDWTASVFLDSTPGDYVSVARQLSSGIWYIVALGRVAHTFMWPLSSLFSMDAGQFEVQRWTESGKSTDTDVVNAGSTLTCSVADDTVSTRHGGCVLRLTPLSMSQPLPIAPPLQLSQPLPIAPPLQLCSPLEELCIKINSLTFLQNITSDVNATFVATYKAAKDIPMYGLLRFTFANNVQHSFGAPVSSSSKVLKSSWDPIGMYYFMLHLLYFSSQYMYISTRLEVLGTPLDLLAKCYFRTPSPHST